MVANTIPLGATIAPLPDIPTTNVTQVYSPIGHAALATLFGFCMCICFIMSTWIYTTDGRDKSHRIALYVVIAVVFCLLVSFMGSVIDAHLHEIHV